MNKISTQRTTELKSVNKFGEQMNPKQSTINFLKQFARVYNYENKLDNRIGSFIAN